LESNRESNRLEESRGESGASAETKEGPLPVGSDLADSQLKTTPAGPAARLGTGPVSWASELGYKTLPCLALARLARQLNGVSVLNSLRGFTGMNQHSSLPFLGRFQDECLFLSFYITPG